MNKKKIATFDLNRLYENVFFFSLKKTVLNGKNTNIIKTKLIVLVLYKKHVKIPTLNYV